jgi:hypothetical protein
MTGTLNRPRRRLKAAKHKIAINERSKLESSEEKSGRQEHGELVPLKIETNFFQ